MHHEDELNREIVNQQS